MESKKMMKVMDRYVDKAMEKYWCTKCERFHKRYYAKKLSLTFFSHYDYKTDITSSRLFQLDFKKKWSNEAKRQIKYKT